MKKVILIALVAFAGGALAQAVEKPQAPQAEALKAAAPEAVKTAAPAQEALRSVEGPEPPAADRKSRRMQDARHCLERQGNFEIIKCAEEYL